jgi:hypothetical protein
MTSSSVLRGESPFYFKARSKTPTLRFAQDGAPTEDGGRVAVTRHTREVCPLERTAEYAG